MSNYPPGCHGNPYDDDEGCEVCLSNVDDCVCPICPVCKEVGSLICYGEHGMVRTQLQRDRLEENIQYQVEEAAFEEELY